MQDVYTQRTLKLMEENGFDKYIDTMGKVEMPAKNKIFLMVDKVREYEEVAKQQIMKEAMDRRAKQNGR